MEESGHHSRLMGTLQNTPYSSFLQNKANKEIMILTIGLGDGKQDTVSVSESDDPNQLAGEFIKKHRLPANLKETIAQYIRDSVKRVKAEKEEQVHNIQKDFKKPGQKGKPQGVKDPNGDSQSMSSLQGESDSYNYGQWLYLRGMKNKQRKQNYLNEVRKHMEEEESRDMTFKPKISQYTQERYRNQKQVSRPEENLLQQGKKKQEKLASMKNLALENERQVCSFNPKINPKSIQLSQNRSATGQRFKELHTDAQIRQERKQLATELQYQESYPFKPSLVTSPQKQKREPREDVVKRLSKSKSEYYKRMEEVREQMNQNELGPNKPTLVSRAPKNRNLGGSVFDHLYTDSSIRKLRQEELQKLHEELNNAEYEARSSQNTDKIYDKMREKRYVELFNSMDDDGDGLISVANINIEMLDLHTIELLEPLFEYLQETQEDMNFEKFKEAVDALASIMTIQDRAFLLKRQDRGDLTDISIMTQESNITNQSQQKKEIVQAVTSRLTKPTGGLNERQLKFKQEKEKKEIEECTFAPTITELKRNKGRQTPQSALSGPRTKRSQGGSVSVQPSAQILTLPNQPVTYSVQEHPYFDESMQLPSEIDHSQEIMSDYRLIEGAESPIPFNNETPVPLSSTNIQQVQILNRSLANSSKNTNPANLIKINGGQH